MLQRSGEEEMTFLSRERNTNMFHEAQAVGRQALETSGSKGCPKLVDSLVPTATVPLARQGKKNNSLSGLGLPDPDEIHSFQ